MWHGQNWSLILENSLVISAYILPLCSSKHDFQKYSNSFKSSGTAFLNSLWVLKVISHSPHSFFPTALFFKNIFYTVMSVLTVMLSFWFWWEAIFFSFSNTVGLQQFRYDCRLSIFYYFISNFTLKGVACLGLDRAVAVLSSHAFLTHPLSLLKMHLWSMLVFLMLKKHFCLWLVIIHHLLVVIYPGAGETNSAFTKPRKNSLEK